MQLILEKKFQPTVFKIFFSNKNMNAKIMFNRLICLIVKNFKLYEIKR